MTSGDIEHVYKEGGFASQLWKTTVLLEYDGQSQILVGSMKNEAIVLRKTQRNNERVKNFMLLFVFLSCLEIRYISYVTIYKILVLQDHFGWLYGLFSISF